MKTWYFTLSESQGGPGCVEVEADDWQHARQRMVKQYGVKWGFQYESHTAVHPADRQILNTLQLGTNNGDL